MSEPFLFRPHVVTSARALSSNRSAVQSSAPSSIVRASSIHAPTRKSSELESSLSCALMMSSIRDDSVRNVSRSPDLYACPASGWYSWKLLASTCRITST